MASLKITIKFAKLNKKLITAQLDKMIGSDSEALAAREHLPEPAQWQHDIIKVPCHRSDSRTFMLSLQTFVESPIKVLLFHKIHVVVGGASFYAWEYQGDKKIYL